MVYGIVLPTWLGISWKYHGNTTGIWWDRAKTAKTLEKWVCSNMGDIPSIYMFCRFFPMGTRWYASYGIWVELPGFRTTPAFCTILDFKRFDDGFGRIFHISWFFPCFPHIFPIFFHGLVGLGISGDFFQTFSQIFFQFSVAHRQRPAPWWFRRHGDSLAAELERWKEISDLGLRISSWRIWSSNGGFPTSMLNDNVKMLRLRC